MDQRGEVWLPEGSDREYPCGLQQHRVVASSRLADRERLRRLLLLTSNRNDLGDGATWLGL